MPLSFENMVAVRFNLTMSFKLSPQTFLPIICGKMILNSKINTFFWFFPDLHSNYIEYYKDIIVSATFGDCVRTDTHLIVVVLLLWK